jgi:prephenate dehydrogenase
LETPAAREFLDWIRRIGGEPVVLGPLEHDRVTSLTSHLPQLASTALAVTLAKRLGSGTHLRVAGPGLRDTTRLARSSFAIWRDIVETNAREIENALDAYIAELQSMREKIPGARLEEEFETASAFSARLRGEPDTREEEC